MPGTIDSGLASPGAGAGVGRPGRNQPGGVPLCSGPPDPDAPCPSRPGASGSGAPPAPVRCGSGASASSPARSGTGTPAAEPFRAAADSAAAGSAAAGSGGPVPQPPIPERPVPGCRFRGGRCSGRRFRGPPFLERLFRGHPRPGHLSLGHLGRRGASGDGRPRAAAISAGGEASPGGHHLGRVRLARHRGNRVRWRPRRRRPAAGGDAVSAGCGSSGPVSPRCGQGRDLRRPWDGPGSRAGGGAAPRLDSGTVPAWTR